MPVVRARFEGTMRPGELVLDVGMHRLVGLMLNVVERALTFSAHKVAFDGREDR